MRWEGGEEEEEGCAVSLEQGRFCVIVFCVRGRLFLSERASEAKERKRKRRKVWRTCSTSMIFWTSAMRT